LYYSALDDQKSRAYIDLTQAYEAYVAAQRQLLELDYSLHWKVLRGKTYLFKKIDSKGNGRVIGPRDPGSERTLAAFRARKAELKSRHADLKARLAEHARLAKALSLARVPRTAAAVLRVLNRQGLLGRNFIVVGTNALYAYEAAAGARFDPAVMDTADVDILWESRAKLSLAADARGAGLIGILRQADRSFQVVRSRGFRAANRDGYMVDLLKPLPRDLIADESPDAIGGNDDLFAAETKNLAWLLSAKKFRATAVGMDGFPVPLVVPDPRLFALHKLWLANQRDREPVKKSRDRAQGRAVLQLLLDRLPQYPLDPKVLRGLPVEVRTQAFPEEL
jgi:hypothetical protein